MLSAVFFFTELFALFLLSRKLTRLITLFAFRFTRSKKATIHILALLFFPGTFIHELSHYLMAVFLNVRVTNMEFVPQIDGHSVKLGSVTFVRPDIFRRLLIGMAPFLFGTSNILGLLYFGTTYQLFENYWFIALTVYTVFEIGNTMFSSRKDMEGALELLIALFTITLVLYLAGLRLPAFDPNIIFGQPVIAKVFEKGSQFLLVPLAIDIVVIIVLSLFRKKNTL